MKIITAAGDQFELKEIESTPIMLTVEIGAPHSDKFHRILVQLDTGADCLTLPESLLEQLGLDHRLRVVDSFMADTAGGKVPEDVCAVDLRIIGQPSGKATLFQGMKAAINPKLDFPVIGLASLRFFALQLKNGQLVYLEFDPKAVEVAQQEADRPSTQILETQIHKLQRHLQKM